MNSTKPNCLNDTNESEVKPIFSSNSFYEFCNDENNVNDQLTIWDLDNMNTSDSSKAMFDMYFNEYQNFNVEEPILQYDKYCNCECITVWNQLVQTFELTDEEILKETDRLNNMYPEDIFYNLPIDLNNNDQDIADFQLDNECMYAQICDTNDIGPNHEENTVIKEEEPIMVGVPSVQPTTRNQIEPKNKQNGIVEKSITKPIVFNDEMIESDKPDKENIENINQEEPIKSKSKLGKNKINRCMENELVKLRNTKEEKRIMNMKYVYTFGEDYRGGIKYGHKNCVDFWMPIPHNKGWIDHTFLEAVSC